MSSSTSLSRFSSSLPRLLRDRHGLPSLPSRARFLGPSSESSTASPARRRLACSVMAAFRMRTSSPRSTSCNLPCIVGRSPNGLAGSTTIDLACRPPCCRCCCFCCSTSASWVAFSAACRLANSDSMYSSLHDQFVFKATKGTDWGHLHMLVDQLSHQSCLRRKTFCYPIFQVVGSIGIAFENEAPLSVRLLAHGDGTLRPEPDTFEP